LQEEPYTAGMPREAPRRTVRPLETERDVSGERLLVRAARDGDQDAIGALFDLHYTSVFRFLYVKTGRQEDAEDLAQEVFLRMIGALERYEERGLPFRAFRMRIAANLVRDHYRKRSNRSPASSTDVPGFDLPADDDPTAVVEQQLALRDVATAMEKLSPAEREVMQLRFGADLSVAETAAALGKNENTVKQLTFKALGKLRKALH
jgi:RNA polymerase sigma-70 factor, ECF subfamily